MINEKQAKRYCKEDIKMIANYKEAIADKERMWDVHHILELDEEWNTAFSKKELISMGLYWKQPACLLVFIEQGMHRSIHHTGKQHSQEAIQKMRYAQIGKKATEETKKKMSVAHSGENNSFYGKTHTDEAKRKIGIANSGKNNGMYGKKMPKTKWLTPDGKTVEMPRHLAKRYHPDWVQI